MFILTPERRFVAATPGIVTDTTIDLATPNSVGQVTIINGITLVQGNAESPVATELNEGVMAVGLTTEVEPGDVINIGSSTQNSQDGNNLVIATLQYQNRVALITTGGVISTIQQAVFNWRGLEFRRRPMSNVDMRFLINITTSSLNVDALVAIYYQVAQLEPGDVGGLSDSLPVGVRIVRGPQIPDEGVAGPAGLISTSA